MSINCMQLKEVIITPALMALGLYSPSAVNLLLGTAAQESQMGHYIKQINGPAIGIFQMESLAYYRIWDSLISPSIAIRAKIRLLLGYEMRPPLYRMASDLMLAVIMARFYYYAIKEPLPAPDDIAGLASYWKRWYNTAEGKGTEQQFIQNYQQYVF